MTDVYPSIDTEAEPALIVKGYHERTKHHFDRFASHLGYMDWATQPDPFRRFEGAAEMPLVLGDDDGTPAYDKLYQPGAIPPQPVTAQSIGHLFYYSMAVSGWKQVQSTRWAVRVNPSSGTLHPTESYLLVADVKGVSDEPCLFHYAPKAHLLEKRATFDGGVWAGLTESLPPGAFFVALSSIFWRESWKYGERAYRYCQLDLGHALGALRLAAALLGWRLWALPTVNDGQLAKLMGVDRDDAWHKDEPEAPDLLIVVTPRGETPNVAGYRPPDELFDQAAAGQWFGRANRLSRDHHPWDAINIVEATCRTTAEGLSGLALAQTQIATNDAASSIMPGPCALSAGRILRQRRSGLEMDGVTGMNRDRFYALLARLVPALCPVPWDAVTWSVLTHLGLFVHRVEGLAPGLYVLVRDAAALDKLRAAMHGEFLWQRPQGCPQPLDLYFLKEGNCQRLAARISCDQTLAGNGVFSLGMFVAFDRALAMCGAPIYRHLYWETGVIGQVLYLEAEAAGLRGTGIGCFFDDPVHEAFGLTDTAFQSFYHFAVGGPVEDSRIASQPAYPDHDSR